MKRRRHPALPEGEHLKTSVSPRWPHDDTASLLAFYGKPWITHSLLVDVPVPFPMTFREDNGHVIPITHILFHKKGAQALTNVLTKINVLYQADHTVIKHVTNFSGSYNYRPIRGSTRLSCHAFGAALDFDSEQLPMGRRFPTSELPQVVYEAFTSEGFYWGGHFIHRPDGMHFQLSHE